MGPIIVVIVTAGSVIGRIHLKGISPLVSVPHLLKTFAHGHVVNVLMFDGRGRVGEQNSCQYMLLVGQKVR